MHPHPLPKMTAQEIMSSGTSAHDNGEATAVDQPCIHLICYYTDSEEQFETVLLKVHEVDAVQVALYPLEYYLLCLNRFVSFWLQPENKYFLDNRLSLVYFAQAAISLLRDEDFDTARTRAVYGLLISMLVQYPNETIYFDWIDAHCRLLLSDASLVHFVKRVIPCHCMDELASHFACPEDFC
jgi:hypothetical protein